MGDLDKRMEGFSGKGIKVGGLKRGKDGGWRAQGSEEIRGKRGSRGNGITKPPLASCRHTGELNKKDRNAQMEKKTGGNQTPLATGGRN